MDHYIITYGIVAIFLFYSAYGYRQTDIDKGENMLQNLNHLRSEFGQAMRQYKVDEELEAQAQLAKKESELADAMTTLNLEQARYVGVGYDQIFGAPEGVFSRGGIDPGIKISRHIHRFTYNGGEIVRFLNQNWRVPDQVTFQLRSSCSGHTEHRAYSGTKSYQSNLAASISAEGSYGAYAFSASTAFQEAQASSESADRVLVDTKHICNYGALRLKEFGIQTSEPAVTDEFIGAVKALPTSYNQNAYINFISQWGSHVIIEADLGTKRITRYTSTYTSSYSFLERATSSNLGVSYSGLTASGSVEISIDTLNQMASFGSTFGEESESFDIATAERPLPIYMRIRPIYRSLESQYWQNLGGSDTYQSLQIATKMQHLTTAFNAYPELVGTLSSDPTLSVRVQWPEGHYGFPQTTSGCPVGFVQGCRYQDNEDSSNRNHFTRSNLIRGGFGRDMEVCYCMRQSNTATGFSFQPGRYCIAKYGNTCPDNFFDGELYWDDEDSSNANRAWGELPRGGYGRDTEMDYCCRGDGNINTPILLPVGTPFVLYQYSFQGCQKVRGMNSQEVIFYTDDEDSSNANRCWGAHPYDNNCSGRDHRVFMCYYS